MTIWQAHRGTDGFDELEPEWREEGALFACLGDAVHAEQIDRPTYLQLLAACASPDAATDHGKD